MNTTPLQPTCAYSDSRLITARLALRGAARRIAATLKLWRQRRRERRELAALVDLDHRTLRDIGLTRCEIESLINKPFWRE